MGFVQVENERNSWKTVSIGVTALNPKVLKAKQIEPAQNVRTQ